MKFLQSITEGSRERQEEFIKRKKEKEKEAEEDTKDKDDDVGMDLDKLEYEYDKIDDWKTLEKDYLENAKSKDEKTLVLNSFKRKIDIYERILLTNKKLSKAGEEMKYDIKEIEDELNDAKKIFDDLVASYKEKFGE